MEQSKGTNEILENAIKTVCHNNGVHKAEYIDTAISRGRNLFTVIGEKEIIPIVGQGITDFWTLGAFVQSIADDIPVMEKNENDARIVQLDKYAKAGNTKAYRELRKQMR